VCSKCLGRMPRLLPPICPRCGRRQASGIVCPVCRQRETDIDGIRSVFILDDVTREAIHQMKYRSVRSLSPYLAGFLADYIESNHLYGEMLLPVPLHPRRLRQRGYNQSGLLAREVGRRTGLPVTEDCLIRVRQVQPQVRAADLQERRRNVADAFVCMDDRTRGKKVIVVDDVCTSGATLEACATALKHRGAASVWGLTLAREKHR